MKRALGNIYKGGFKKWNAQSHSNCSDIFHPGFKVGEGIYISPSIEIAEQYAGILKINNIYFKTVLMCRVKPDAIRGCSHDNANDYRNHR